MLQRQGGGSGSPAPAFTHTENTRILMQGGGGNVVRSQLNDKSSKFHWERRNRMKEHTAPLFAQWGAEGKEGGGVSPGSLHQIQGKKISTVSLFSFSYVFFLNERYNKLQQSQCCSLLLILRQSFYDISPQIWSIGLRNNQLIPPCS